MNSTRLTEGAKRAIEQSQTVARQASAIAVQPWHLLRALLLEESHAAEILIESGLELDILDKKLARVAGVANAEDSVNRSTAEILSESSAFKETIVEAHRHETVGERASEVGTVHLLLALSRVDSTVSEILCEQGLSEARIAVKIHQVLGITTEPIAVDFTINRQGPSERDRINVLRTIDAAANRAREGVRVIEDFVRFTLDDRHLSSLLKSWRHDLGKVFSAIDAAELLAARDTLDDVGTELTTDSERSRQTTWDVVVANFKRVEEAMRSLEEFGKLISPLLGDELSLLRYRFYTIEKAVGQTTSNQRRLEGRRLYLLVSESACQLEMQQTIRQAILAGAKIVQLREKRLSDRQLIELGKQVCEWTRAAGGLFIMNDRPDLAALLDADGVHVGQDELTVRQARQIVGPNRLVGVSTHTIEQARAAVIAGADYLGVGPVFSSVTKDFEQLAGLEFVKRVADEITLPWFAIGGIDLSNIENVLKAGASRIAVSSSICGSPNPDVAAGKLTNLITSFSANEQRG